MNISSILITIVGIIIIIALYAMSRAGQNKLPRNESAAFPDIKDDNGDQFTSILDDIAATDGIAPVVPHAQKPQATSNQDSSNNNNQSQESSQKHQIVLFMSANEGDSLDGDLIKQSLLDHHLILGDKDIYHYHMEAGREANSEANNQMSSSLFRVANGIEPWTLKDQDLDGKRIVGLSLVMFLPTVIETKEAIKLFIQKAESIAIQANGVLKNQQQQTLTDKDKQEILDM